MPIEPSSDTPANDRNTVATGAEATRRPTLRRVYRLVRWMVGVVLVTLALRLLLHAPAPLRALHEVRIEILGAMVILIVVNQMLMSWRYKVVMQQCVGARVSQLQWFRLTSVGQFLNLFVPQLGHIHRAIVLKADFGMSYAAYTSGMLVYFWFELFTSGLLAIIIVGAANPQFRLGVVLVLPVLVAGVIGLLALPLILRALGRGRLGTLGGRAFGERICQVARDAQHAWGRRDFVATFLALNAVAVLVHLGILSLAFGAVGSDIALETLLVFQSLLKLSSQLLITPGNLGVNEFVYGVLSHATSGGIQDGIAAALLTRALGTLVTIALGAALGGIRAAFGARFSLRTGQAPEVRRDSV